ncbi:uncharacterized protein LOC127102908 [Lathyrus oleraceus]|uniref:uncharacterized protein LOC127102908 n=1 Tax=Pisum sativum TaxID=3888 RepID=UPI0021D09E88|nr:uncharacterized protein LOC127102908 [Pisum sativum]
MTSCVLLGHNNKVDDKAGCGGLIRDSFGKWISGYSKNLGVCNSLVVGLRGVLEWLMIARMLGMKVGEVSEDSIQVANDINNRKILNPMGRTLMNRIRDLIDLEWKIGMLMEADLEGTLVPYFVVS